VIALEATPDLGSVDIALVPRAGSRLAKFVAAQRPSNHALLDRLPDGPATALFSGRIELGPYRDQTLQALASFYGTSGSKEMLAGMQAISRLMTGEMAATARTVPGGGFAFTQLFGVSDAAAADRAMGAILSLYKDGQSFEAMGMTTTIKVNPGTVPHDGVALRSYESSVDFSKVRPADKAIAEAMTAKTSRVHVGVFDRLGLIAFGPDSLAEATRAIDAARGKIPRFTAPPSVGQLLASSRARKDSIVLMMDLGAIMSSMAAAAGKPAQPPAAIQPLVISFGGADRAAHLRVAVPASTARSAVNLSKP
jgi:hypothetical protein